MGMAGGDALVEAAAVGGGKAAGERGQLARRGCGHAVVRRVPSAALRTGRSLDDAGLTGPAVEYWRELAARCDAKLGPGHPDSLVMAGHLAGANLAAGAAAEAVELYKRVLAEQSRELAPGHPAVITTRVSLGRALLGAGEPAGAVTTGQFRGPRPAMWILPSSRHRAASKPTDGGAGQVGGETGRRRRRRPPWL